MTTETTKLEIPKTPEHLSALEPTPEDVKASWKKTYADAYEEARQEAVNDGKGVDEKILHGQALVAANKRHIRVKEPKTYEDALALPKYQLMIREEVEWGKMPLHGQREVRDAEGRTSGNYLRVYTTDGKEYFFPVPETKQ